MYVFFNSERNSQSRLPLIHISALLSFSIDYMTGVITVQNCLPPGSPGEDPCINFERKKKYALSVAATDNNGDRTTGRSRTVQVMVNVLDVNDNAPQPEASYIRYINEMETVTINPLIIEVEKCSSFFLPFSHLFVL